MNYGTGLFQGTRKDTRRQGRMRRCAIEGIDVQEAVACKGRKEGRGEEEIVSRSKLKGKQQLRRKMDKENVKKS